GAGPELAAPGQLEFAPIPVLELEHHAASLRDRGVEEDPARRAAEVALDQVGGIASGVLVAGRPGRFGQAQGRSGQEELRDTVALEVEMRRLLTAEEH